MGKQQKFIIWTGAILLIMMLACIYAAIGAIYENLPVNIPSEYIASVLRPSSFFA